jgi:O-antigen ligase
LLQGKISSFFLLLVVFSLPISGRIFIITLWPWIFFLLLESFINRGKQWSGLKMVPTTVFFLPGLFLLLLISMLWTENKVEGWNHIGRSALMIIFPILLGFDKTLATDKRRMPNLLKSYTYGALVSLLVLVINALIYSISFNNGSIEFNPHINHWEHAFFHDRFSVLIHPTYYGMMILMAAVICINEVRKNNFFSKSPLWPVLFAVSLIGSLFLISSRSMIFASAMVIAWFILMRIQDKIIRIGSFVAVLVTLIFLGSLHPRFNKFLELLREQDGSVSYSRLLTETNRSKTWKASFSLVKEYPVLGVGIGDVKDSISKIYLEEEYFDKSQNYLNCHNQFLETWLGVGIVGVLLLIVILAYPLLISQFYNKYLYWSFLIISLTGFLFESLLNRLWGVAFFSIFYTLLTGTNKITSKVKVKSP